MRSVLALLVLLAAPAVHAQDGQTIAVMQLADQAEQILNLLDQDAQFAAQGAIGVGDSDGWQRYQAFSTPAHTLAWDFHNISWDLSTGTPLIAEAMQWRMDKSQLTSLEMAYARLPPAPPEMIDRYFAFLDLERQFAGAIQIQPPNPNGEPDQPGHWLCNASWSMNGAYMNFQGEADSRNAAKAAALAQCQQRFTQFCELGSCQLANPMPAPWPTPVPAPRPPRHHVFPIFGG